MRSMNHNPKARVSVGEIAEMAGVSPSAVSNWRRRHKDFPLPVEATAGGDLFELESVTSWLDSRGKKYTLPTGGSVRSLWRAVDLLRDELRLEDAVLLILQLLLIRARAELGGHARHGHFRQAWEEMVGAPVGTADHWHRLWASVDDPDLARALEPLPGLRPNAMARAVSAVSEVSGDWGEMATTLLQRLHKAAGVRGAEYHTPPSVAALMVGLLSPIVGAVYDPACGSAMFLADAWKKRVGEGVELIGQDVNEFSWRLGYLHLALHRANFRLDTGDTLLDDRFRSVRADRIAIDPPLGRKSRVDELIHDARWTFGVPMRGTEWLWVQHGLYHLSDVGIGVVVVTSGALSGHGPESHIRAGILESEFVDAVIDLPPGMIAGTQISMSLIVLDADRRSRKGRTLFIDGRQLGHARRGQPHELREEDVQKVLSTVEAWRNAEFEPEPRFSASARRDEILEKGADLSPRRYVQYATPVSEIAGEPIPERFARLATKVQDRVPNAISALETAAAHLRAFTHAGETDWPMVRLGDLLAADPRTGSRLDPDGDYPAVPYIETVTVSGGDGRLTAVPKTVTRGNTRGRLTSRGDVLLVSRGIDAAGRIGCATIAFDDEAAYSESLLRLSPDTERLDPDYLRLFLTSRQGRAALVAATTGSVIANLRAEALVEIEIRLPDLSTQREIAAVVRRIESGLAEMDAFQRAVADTVDAIREGVAAGLFIPGPRGTDSAAE